MKLKTRLFLMTIIVMAANSAFALNVASILHPEEVGFHLVGTRQDASQMGGSGVGPGAEIFLGYHLNKKLHLAIGAGFMTATDDIFKAKFSKAVLLPSLEARLSYTLSKSNSFRTFIFMGFHVYSEELKYKTASGWSRTNSGYSGSALIGAGAALALGKSGHWLNITADYRYGILSSATVKPQYWVGKIGFIYNIQKNKQLTKNDNYYNDLNAFMSDQGQGEIAQDTSTHANSENIQSRLEMLEALTMSNANAIDGIKNNEVTNIPEVRKVDNNDQTVIIVTNYNSSYNEGLSLFRLVKYDKSIMIFHALLKEDSNNALTSNVLYWIGECKFAQGLYRQAIDSFNSVLEFTKSHKRDDALLKKGICYTNLENFNDANATFEELINNYPKSEYVQRARKYIENADNI
ncbi:tetratricopeptide repeat protein [bacterium]|nr:tetratricopeptide repeat protein [bacterium]